MQLAIAGLKAHLSKPLAPLYVLSGNEPLQMRKCADLIRQAAIKAGFSERQRMSVNAQFQWQDLLQEAASMSLFGDKKIIDLVIESGKPGTEGSKVLAAYAQQPSIDNILIIHLPKLDANQKKSKWFKALDKAGAILQIWPIEDQQLIQWLNTRLRAKGLNPEPALAPLLAEHIEGNLLAAQQEIDKLFLIHGPANINCEQLLEAVTDSARFDVFKLVDSALEGKTQRSLRILQGLKSDGTASAIILWALSREIRMLCQIAQQANQGQSIQRIIQSRHDIWPKRKPIVRQGIARLNLHSWQQLLQTCQRTDQAIKGISNENPWLLLHLITANLSGIKMSLSAQH